MERKETALNFLLPHAPTVTARAIEKEEVYMLTLLK